MIYPMVPFPVTLSDH